jgi:hypothetical protein
MFVVLAVPAAAVGDSVTPEPPYELLTATRSPRAGEKFNSVVLVVREPQTVAAATVSCDARVRGRALRGSAQRFFQPTVRVPKTIVLSWAIPRAASGRDIDASCQVELRTLDSGSRVDTYDALRWRIGGRSARGG